MTNLRWLDWAQRLQTLAQAGLTYTENPYDLERYHIIQGLAAEILAEYSGGDFPRALALLEKEQGYATPKVDARGVIFRDDSILLVRELSDGGWTIPGGWMDVGEPPSKNVEREVYEETGYSARATRLLAVYDRSMHGHPPHLYTIYKLFFLCEITGGQPVDSHETAGAAFFPVSDLPPLSTQRTTLEEIQRIHRLYRDPSLPVEFD